MEIEVGSYVKAVDDGGSYPRYHQFFEDTGMMSYANKFKGGTVQIGQVYKVVARAPHPRGDARMVYVLEAYGGQIYLCDNIDHSLILAGVHLTPDKFFEDVIGGSTNG